MNHHSLEKISDKIYKSIEGYFIYKDNEWSFLPLDKQLTINILSNIIDTLKDLNELQRIS
jgi:hypothetical protein